MEALLERWVSFLRRKAVLVTAAFLGLVAWGGYVAHDSEIQAFPELTNVQVQIITQYPGKASEEVERQVTVPIEVATTGITGLINQRSISEFGLSVVTLTFDDDARSRQARLDTAERLRDANLPDGVKPGLQPDSTPLGEVYRYTLKGHLPVDELRLIEDWTLEREFKSIPGVADVSSYGGPTRTIEVRLDQARMNAFGLTVAAVAQALGQNHVNAGGSVLTRGDEAHVVRSLGLYEKPESLLSAVVATQKGVPVRVRDLGTVELGRHQRLGQEGRGVDDDIVLGDVLLRTGADTLKTCAAIREKIDRLNHGGLPEGVTIETVYDRTTLITQSSNTVLHNVLEGVGLVCVLLALGIGLRYAGLVLGVALIIPFALIISFVGIRLCGYAPNLISLGAVDFGVIVETAIFAAEAVAVAVAARGDREPRTIARAMAGVMAPALICALLLLVAFVPILALQRVEGRIFKPLGVTLVAALAGGQLGALLLVPAFASLVPVGPGKPGLTDRLFAAAGRACVWTSTRLAKLPAAPALTLAVFAAAVLAVGWGIGREFLPNLNEGALWVRITAPPTISREASVRLAAEVRRRFRTIPEVTDVVSQIGRPDDGTDVNGFDNIELYVGLTPPSAWRTAHDIDGFIAAAQTTLKGIEGIEANFSQPIKDNVDEAISGVKGELVLKIFGPALPELQRLADAATKTLKVVPGAEDVASEQLMQQPELRFTMDRDKLARYGLRVADAEDVLESALLGKLATKMTDDQGRAIDVLVKPDLPDNPDEGTLAALPVLTPDGGKIPLGDVSAHDLVEGVSRVYREQGERRIAVKCSVRDRPVVDFVKDADARIRAAVPLPDHFRFQWSGSFENAERAAGQLLVIVPLCLVAMLIILYTWFGSWRLVGFLLWEIPFAAVGGLAALRLAGLNLSISAAAGGVVLTGVTFLTAMMLLTEWRHAGSATAALKEKLRSIVVSNGVAIVGLIPAALSHGIGSETARPFAVMILGGLISSLVFSVTILPALMARSRLDQTGSGEPLVVADDARAAFPGARTRRRVS